MAFSSIASAKMVDVVHLKNGSIIQGMVTEMIPSETAKIETDDGSVFLYQFDEIQSITKKTEPIGKVTTSTGLPKRYLPYAVGLGCGSGCLSSYLPIPILGLGQVYNGEYTKALIFLGVGAIAGYEHNGIMLMPSAAMFIIGVIIWIQRSRNKALIDAS